MLGLSFEHIIIIFVILLIFGPKKLPELGNTLGKAIKNFKDSVSGTEEPSYRKLPDTENNADPNAEKLADSSKSGTANPYADAAKPSEQPEFTGNDKKTGKGENS
jgi:sec-independent protein translocase protein TatA